MYNVYNIESGVQLNVSPLTLEQATFLQNLMRDTVEVRIAIQEEI